MLFEQFEERRVLAVANDDSVATTQGVSTAGSMWGNDLYDPATVAGGTVSSPANGSLALGSDGYFEYTPNPGFWGTDSFTYEISDIDGPSSATVSIEVTQDLTPIAYGDSYIVGRGSTLSVAPSGVLANDYAPSGQSLTAYAAGGANNGSLELSSDGSFTYTPNAGYSGPDTFFYYVSDGNTYSNLAVVWINVNDPPIAADDSYTTAQNTPLTIAAPGVLVNDTDSDGEYFTAVPVSAPAHGTLELASDGRLVYTPEANYSGTDSFTYSAFDGNFSNFSPPATVWLTVVPVDASLVAANDTYETISGQTLVRSAPGLLANDTAPTGATITAVLADAPTAGTVTLNPDGSFTYVPNSPFFTIDTFTYRLSSGQAVSPLATVTIESLTAPDIAITKFYSDGVDFRIQYAVLGTAIGPFSIAIYASPDGQILEEQLEIKPAIHTQGLHTLTIAPQFTDPRRDYYLVAKIDANNEIDELYENDNVARFLPGAFIVHETASGRAVLHVHDGDTGQLMQVCKACYASQSGWTVRTPQTAVAAPATGPAYDFTGDGLVTALDASAYNNYQIGNPLAWQNPANRFDVNGDGFAAPSDALVLINDFNAFGEHLLTGSPPANSAALDVSGDRVASVLDIAQLLDKLNGGSGNVNPPGRNAAAPYSATATEIQSFLAVGMKHYGNITIDEVHLRAHGGDDGGSFGHGVIHAPGWIFGGDGDDMLGGSDFDDYLDGGPGQDFIFGVGGDDLIFGGPNVDWLFGDYPDDGDNFTYDGPAGNDVIYGGDEPDGVAGNGGDWIQGNGGDDQLFGEAGYDIIEGNAGNDTITGATGNDTLDGGNGNDSVSGNSGNDAIQGGAGNDELHGGPGDDSLSGGEDDDWLTGDEGEDDLSGNGGDDALDGGDDDDSLNGGTGNNVISGGDGQNTTTSGGGNDTHDDGTNVPRDANGVPCSWPVYGITWEVDLSSNDAGENGSIELYFDRIQPWRWPGPDGVIHVLVELIDGTAQHGLDYGGPTSFNIEIPGGEDAQFPVLAIPMLQDDLLPWEEDEEGEQDERGETFYIRFTTLERLPCDGRYERILITDSTIRAEDDAQVIDTLEPELIFVLGNDYPPYGLEVAPDFTDPQYGDLEPFYQNGKFVAFQYTRDPQHLYTDDYFTYQAKRGEQVSNSAFVYILQADPPPPVRVSTVNFLNNLGLRSDPRVAPGDTPLPGTNVGMGWTNYATAHEYYDFNADGQIAAPTDHAYPVAYVRDSIVNLMGTLKVVGPGVIADTYGPNIRIKASGDITMEPVNGSINTGGRSVSFAGQSASRLPEQVGVDDNFKIDWEISFNAGASWHSAGSSTQKLYRTLAEPLANTELFETVVWLGSSFGTGATSEAALFPPVWANFSGRGVTRLDNTPMTYWGQGENTPRIHITSHILAYADGRCDAWVDLFREVLAAQGIESIRQQIVPKTISYGTKPGLLINNWDFPLAAKVPNADLPGVPADREFWVYQGLVRQDGIGGQNKLRPYATFDNHVIVEYNQQYYDPSYGRGPYNTLPEWEAAALEGILFIKDIYPPGLPVLPKIQIVMRQNNGKHDTKFAD